MRPSAFKVILLIGVFFFLGATLVNHLSAVSEKISWSDAGNNMFTIWLITVAILVIAGVVGTR